MRPEWFGDNRDLVKWSVAVHLASTSGCRLIVQVPFLPEVSIGKTVLINGQQVAVPNCVTSHFRDLVGIERMNFDALSIKVFEQLWRKPREEYFKQLQRFLLKMKDRKLVLLDPDTGIAPRTLRMEHVSPNEINRVWHSLQKGDWLLVYQHKWRDRGWKVEAQRRFEDACDGAASILCEGNTIASDVVLFGAIFEG